MRRCSALHVDRCDGPNGLPAVSLETWKAGTRAKTRLVTSATAAAKHSTRRLSETCSRRGTPGARREKNKRQSEPAAQHAGAGAEKSESQSLGRALPHNAAASCAERH